MTIWLSSAAKNVAVSLDVRVFRVHAFFPRRRQRRGREERAGAACVAVQPIGAGGEAVNMGLSLRGQRGAEDIFTVAPRPCRCR